MEGNPEQEPELVESPVINITSSIGQIALTWINCRLRMFGNDIYDHVEFTNSEGVLRAFVPTPEIHDLMYENDYPMAFDPIVDPATERWFLECQHAGLDAELEHFFDERQENE
jgi:hypothetical protein